MRKKKIIIAIHGLGNKPGKELLLKWWLLAINEGLTRIDRPRRKIPLEMIYWADVLYEKPLDPAVKDEDDPSYLDEPYIPGAPEAPEVEDNLRTKVMRFIERNLDKVFLNKDMTLNFSQLTDRIIHNYFSDLETYFSAECVSVNDPECLARNVIRNRLTEVLYKYRNYDIMLIGHSMGSIIAYDVLVSHDDLPDVHSLVTIGSPLGLPVIVSRLYADIKKNNPSMKKLHTPENVYHHWINISDYDDKVALDHTLSDDYIKNSQGVAARDIYVRNDYIVNGEANPHKIYGYLRTPEFAAILDEFLGPEKRGFIYKKFQALRSSLRNQLQKIKRLWIKDEQR